MSKALPIDRFLQIENLPLHERINARRSAEFEPGNKKFSTKREMGELACELNHDFSSESAVDISTLGADGFAMLFDRY